MLTKHMELLQMHHKEVTAINLVNQHGGEGKLCTAFQVWVCRQQAGVKVWKARRRGSVKITQVWKMEVVVVVGVRMMRRCGSASRACR